jgi:predicted acetyltransferase
MKIQIKNIQFTRVDEKQKIAHLKKECRATLTSPPDGMWESFREQAQDWKIIYMGVGVGYASVDATDQLLQFYIEKPYLVIAKEILKTFVAKHGISKGMVGTNNPVFMTAALPNTVNIQVDTYLFRDFQEVEMEDKDGVLIEGKNADLDVLINFYHKSIGADREWLSTYLGERISKKELFYLEHRNIIIGACEVRTSLTNQEIADIGMVVSPDHRRKGYGSFLLNKAKKLGVLRNQKPICSCEANNLGSFYSITNAGFVSNYQLLKVTF